MKRVGKNHFLALDINTDKSHLFKKGNDTPILTFDSDTRCNDSKGFTIAHVRLSNNYWTVKNDLGITTTPVSFNEVEGIFKVEADFCTQWLQLQGISP